MSLIIDLFAGGGGASTGIKAAVGRDPDAAINHDRLAVAMHAANHPGTWHLCEDVFAVPPLYVTDGRRVDLLWASPDCTHHSKARGGKPDRSVKRRGLAWVVEKWALIARPRVIILENVEEFQDWGPLKDGLIVDGAKGDTFRAFVRRLRRLGYRVEWTELRACDYGAPTIRKRLFLVARCDGLPIVWPEPTHGDPASEAVLSGRLLPWRTAAECIDWDLPCPSIFDTSEEIKRKYGVRAIRPLADKTLARIAAGIKKYVIEHPEPFIVDYYGQKRRGEFRGCGMGEPLTTTSTENRHGLVAPFFKEVQNGSHKGSGTFGINRPFRTITAYPKGGGHALAAPCMVSNTTGHAPIDARGPLSTIATGGHHMAVAALLKHYGGVVGQDARVPAGTVTSVDHHALMAASLDIQHGRSRGSGAGDPLSTLLGHNKQALVASTLAKLKGTGRACDLRDPMHTVQAGGGHYAEVRAFLCKYYGTGGQHQAANEPMHTLTARARMGLVTVRGVNYVIVDIGMRMLTPRELFRAQGFSEDYVIDPLVDGKPMTKTAQVRMVGNSVCPQWAEALVKANCAELCQRREAA